MKHISIEELPPFIQADYLNPWDCIVQGYRTRRIPINSVLDLIKDRGAFELESYHFGDSANGRYVRYSHVIRIDQKQDRDLSYSISNSGAQFQALSMNKLYDALWKGPFNEQNSNIDMMSEVHTLLAPIVNEHTTQLRAIEVDQFGNQLDQFDLDCGRTQQFNILEKEQKHICWIELPVFSVYVTELPPEIDA